MTTKNVLLIIIALAALGGGWYFMNKRPVLQLPQTDEVEVRVVEVTYVSMTGETVTVEYTGGETALLRSADTGVIRFESAVSGSGARYVSADGALVLWNKGKELTITRGDEVVFEGTEPAKLGEASPLTASWVWIGNEGDSEISPKRADAFVLAFDTKGIVSGTTDCNSFSGAYDVTSMGSLSFGALAATEMFCEGSQEIEFTEYLSRVTSYIVSDGVLVLVVADGETRMLFRQK